MNLYQKKREKKELEQQLLQKESQKTEYRRKLECAEQIIQANRRALMNIEYFQQENMQVMRRFQGICSNQRSVKSMQYILENRISGQAIRDLYGNVEGKIGCLVGMADSFEDQINHLNREISRIEEKIEKLEREIRLQAEM